MSVGMVTPRNVVGLVVASLVDDAQNRQWPIVSTMSADQTLAAGTAREADWRSAVDTVLGDSSFDEMLVSSTRSGLDIQPLYTGRLGDGQRVGLPDADRVAHGWDVRTRHQTCDPTDPDQDRSLILDELERGATSIELGRPTSGWTTDRLRRTLDGVRLDLAPVVLSPHSSIDDANALLALIGEQPDAAATRSWLGLDPVGEWARGGAVNKLEQAADFASQLPERHPNMVGFTVDTTRYVDAGANESQELAWMLATGVAYLRALEQAGLAVAEAAHLVGFRVSVDADQFLNIARLRAARLLWSKVLEASGVPALPQVPRLHAVTSPVIFSRRDPWVNMLRSTAAVLGAGVGGADAITVLSFDGTNSALARRNARNTQLVLIEECGLSRLVDPAAGSWFVESLTQRLAESAWTAFQDVEATGGIVVALESGRVRDEVDQSWNARAEKLASRAEPVTGVSEFPDSAVSTSGFVDGAAAPTGWPLRRPAVEFERLRDVADRSRLDGGDPRVHIAALGPLSAHTPRTSWVTNLLAVGGVGVTGGSSDGSDSPLQAEAEFASSGLLVAVICSSDAIYAERADATARALKEAGASFVAYAGRPGSAEGSLRAAGVDEFWHVGIDVVATLRTVHAQLGLS